MAQVIIDDTNLSNIASAIRGKNGSNETYKPSEMAAAINDIKSGSESVDAFVARTITEIYSPSATWINAYCMSQFKQLESVYCPNVTSTGTEICSYCSALEYAYFPKLSTIPTKCFYQCSALPKYECTEENKQIQASAFYGCSKLETLILRRTESITSLSSSSALERTLIDDGTGYIYVPSALYGTYRNATNWNIYKDQIRKIEEYPEICGEVAQ